MPNFLRNHISLYSMGQDKLKIYSTLVAQRRPERSIHNAARGSALVVIHKHIDTQVAPVLR